MIQRSSNIVPSSKLKVTVPVPETKATTPMFRFRSNLRIKVWDQNTCKRKPKDCYPLSYSVIYLYTKKTEKGQEQPDIRKGCRQKAVERTWETTAFVGVVLCGAAGW